MLKTLSVNVKTTKAVKNMEDVDTTHKSNYCGQGGCGAQHNMNWRNCRGGRVNSNLTNYCWTHGMCAYPGKYCRTLEGGNQKDTLWCNKM